MGRRRRTQLEPVGQVDETKPAPSSEQPSDPVAWQVYTWKLERRIERSSFTIHHEGRSS